MRQHSSRRLLVIPCAIAVMVPTVLLLNPQPNPRLSDGVAGLIIGGLLGVSIGLVMKLCRFGGEGVSH